MVRKLSILWLVGAIAGCAASAPIEDNTRLTSPASVQNLTWQWEATTTPTIKTTDPSPERYTILLKEDGKVQTLFDCNRGGGSYEISEGKLSLGPMMSTIMACPEDSLDALFMRDLQRVDSFFVQSGRLHLDLSDDAGVMHFQEAP